MTHYLNERISLRVESLPGCIGEHTWTATLEIDLAGSNLLVTAHGADRLTARRNLWFKLLDLSGHVTSLSAELQRDIAPTGDQACGSR